MPQKRESLKSGKMYHVWTHANGSENLFRTDDNYFYFLEKYIYHVHPVVETFAYCLMPNHLHLMIRVRKEREVLEFLREKKNKPDLQGFGNSEGLSKVISQQFSNLFNAYTKAYNKYYDRMGSLFVSNFRRNQIDSAEYFSRLIIYIHNNPVHHGFVDSTGDWPHSSWHAYLSDEKTKIAKDESLRWFGGLEQFKKLHKTIDTSLILER